MVNLSAQNVPHRLKDRFKTKKNLKSLSLFKLNKGVRGTAQIREELHQFINRADERILNLIYGMMKADSEDGDFTLNEAQKQLLDERLVTHQASPHEGSDWKEVKDRITHKT